MKELRMYNVDIEYTYIDAKQLVGDTVMLPVIAKTRVEAERKVRRDFKALNLLPHREWRKIKLAHISAELEYKSVWV